MGDIEAVNTVHRIIQDKDTALRVARALIADHERTIVAQRAEIEKARTEIARLTAQRNQTYEVWRAARSAELLCVQTERDEAQRANRRLVEDYANLQGRLSQVEEEADALSRELAALRATAARVAGDVDNDI